jgi:uncharacterized protein YdhG (YjbR/CyaY superfamily)
MRTASLRSAIAPGAPHLRRIRQPQQPTTIDDYIATLPDDVQPILQNVRQAIRAALPDAEERIRYGMPAIMLNDRYALHFAGWKKHVGLYPIPVLTDALEAEIAPYRTHKDSLRFLYSRPIPYDVIERLAAELGQSRRATGPSSA